MGQLTSANFEVTPNPMETQAGKVTVTINGKFPAKYMKKNVIVTITPELRGSNGYNLRAEEGTSFQGEKVRNNFQTISYEHGGNFTMRQSFDYADALHRSDLYMNIVAKQGKKETKQPLVKVASGIIATSELYQKALKSEQPCLAPDSFQRVTNQKMEAQVKFLVNQANLRKSELASNSVKDFVEMLRKINREHESLNLKNVEVLGYASPEGNFAVNDRLANQRQSVSEEFVKGQMKQARVSGDVTSHYTAEDWDGFQKLVAASNIQDKDVILRVLSMYQDPEQREQQIRNMSEGFRELADGILPELRRARMIINYETVGRSDEQLKQQYAADPTKLSLDELLYTATLYENPAESEDVYKKTAELFPNDYRAKNNVGVMEMIRGNELNALDNFQEAMDKGKQPEAYANMAMMALQHGGLDTAEEYLSNATGAAGMNRVLGTLNIAKGNYSLAQQNLTGESSNMAALAQILNKDYSTATQTLARIKDGDALTDYLNALLLARTGQNDKASEFLRKAAFADPSLASFADRDIEMQNVKK
jgi:Flp pilus assembly protein TadD